MPIATNQNLPEHSYYTLSAAAKVIGRCEDDLIHWGATQRIELMMRKPQGYKAYIIFPASFVQDFNDTLLKIRGGSDFFLEERDEAYIDFLQLSPDYIKNIELNGMHLLGVCSFSDVYRIDESGALIKLSCTSLDAVKATEVYVCSKSKLVDVLESMSECKIYYGLRCGEKYDSHPARIKDSKDFPIIKFADLYITAAEVERLKTLYSNGLDESNITEKPRGEILYREYLRRTSAKEKGVVESMAEREGVKTQRIHQLMKPFKPKIG